MPVSSASPLPHSLSVALLTKTLSAPPTEVRCIVSSTVNLIQQRLARYSYIAIGCHIGFCK